MYPFNINPTNKPALTQLSIKPATIQPTCINPELQPDSMHHSKTRWTAVDSFESYSAQLQNTVDVALVLFDLIPEKAGLFLVSRVDVLGPPPSTWFTPQLLVLWSFVFTWKQQVAPEIHTDRQFTQCTVNQEVEQVTNQKVGGSVLGCIPWARYWTLNCFLMHSSECDKKHRKVAFMNGWMRHVLYIRTTLFTLYVISTLLAIQFKLCVGDQLLQERHTHFSSWTASSLIYPSPILIR